MTTLNLDHFAIVLVEPQIPENKGAVARAMNNMGIRRLILVKPERCDLTRILRMATGTSIDIVEEMEVFEDLNEALASFHYVIGTTARIGAQRPSLTNPRDLAQSLVLCERGIRTFEDYVRNTFPLAIVPELHRVSHLPVVVDPSHGTGKSYLVDAMCRAAVAGGADGLIVEVHHDPEHAMTDGAQTLAPQQFSDMMAAVRRVAAAVDRSL